MYRGVKRSSWFSHVWRPFVIGEAFRAVPVIERCQYDLSTESWMRKTPVVNRLLMMVLLGCCLYLIPIAMLTSWEIDDNESTHLCPEPRPCKRAAMGGGGGGAIRGSGQKFALSVTPKTCWELGSIGFDAGRRGHPTPMTLTTTLSPTGTRLI